MNIGMNYGIKQGSIMKLIHVKVLLLLLLTTLLTSCGEEETIKENVISKLNINAALLSLEVNETYSLISIASYVDTTTEVITKLGNWYSSDNTIASVTEGQVVAISSGQIKISYEYNGHRAEIPVIIEPQPQITHLFKYGDIYVGEKLVASSVCQYCNPQTTQYTWLIDRNNNQIFNDTIEVAGVNVSDLAVIAPSYTVQNEDMGKRLKLQAYTSSEKGFVQSTTEDVIYRSLVVDRLFNNDVAFTALKNDGSVVTWATGSNGSEQPILAGVEQALANDVIDIKSNSVEFIAEKIDGSLVIWNFFGEDRSPLVQFAPIKKVVAFADNLAIVRSNNTVTTVNRFDDGTTLALGSDVTEVFNSEYAYTAQMKDGSLRSWESNYFGGITSAPTEFTLGNITEILSVNGKFFAIQDNGSVEYWPKKADDNIIFTEFNGLSSFHSTLSQGAHVAKKSDNTILVWGDKCFAGELSIVTIDAEHYGDTGECNERQAINQPVNVESIASTLTAFATLDKNGAVSTWGLSVEGGSSKYPVNVTSQLAADVTTVVGNNSAFAALKINGQVVTWGSKHSGGDSSQVNHDLVSGVTSLAATSSAFAALKADGSVISWGSELSGGTMSKPLDVSSELLSGVVELYATDSAFVALKENSTIVSWGGRAMEEVIKIKLLPQEVIEFSSIDLNNLSMLAR